MSIFPEERAKEVAGLVRRVATAIDRDPIDTTMQTIQEEPVDLKVDLLILATTADPIHLDFVKCFLYTHGAITFTDESLKSLQDVRDAVGKLPTPVLDALIVPSVIVITNCLLNGTFVGVRKSNFIH